MSRQEFLGKLRAGLYGLPQARISEIVADYESHFEEGRAAGRSDSEVAAALGDPARLAKELRAEAHVERWKEERTPSAGAAAVIALIGLIALDWFFLLPILFVVMVMLFVMGVTSIALFFAGLGVLIGGIVGHVDHLTPVEAIVAGIGCAAGGAALGSLTAMIGIGGAKLLVMWARLHAQVVKPAQIA
ncbi:MAG: hypothetical protein JWM33_596 [Caulobacteraceae bacterium]|nr:hypothetical protein [Caulobacteraceae bacterium]